MWTNRGTLEGNNEEISFVKTFNKKKNDAMFSVFTKNIKYNISDVYMVRVSTNQFSKLSNKNTKTRSDCYAIYTKSQEILKILEENDYYLNENIIRNIDYTIIEKSGISIKMSDSNRYQILKIGPNSFQALFGCYELGAGASLFCKRDDELVKNKKLLEGWNTTLVDMKNYFSCITNLNDLTSNQKTCQTIKKISIKKIENMINNSVELQQAIFNGYPIYDDPYSAWYIYAHGELKKLTYIPFIVTTGSGRSHGDYTIVLKPKNED